MQNIAHHRWWSYFDDELFSCDLFVERANAPSTRPFYLTIARVERQLTNLVTTIIHGLERWVQRAKERASFRPNGSEYRRVRRRFNELKRLM